MLFSFIGVGGPPRVHVIHSYTPGVTHDVDHITDVQGVHGTVSRAQQVDQVLTFLQGRLSPDLLSSVRSELQFSVITQQQSPPKAKAPTSFKPKTPTKVATPTNSSHQTPVKTGNAGTSSTASPKYAGIPTATITPQMLGIVKLPEETTPSVVAPSATAQAMRSMGLGGAQDLSLTVDPCSDAQEDAHNDARLPGTNALDDVEDEEEVEEEVGDDDSAEMDTDGA